VTTDTGALEREVRARRQALDRLAGRAQQVAMAGRAVKAEITRLEHQADVHAKVAALLTRIGEQAQESARRQFETLATLALRRVFGDEYGFGFTAGETGGQATLEPVIRSTYDGVTTETPVMDARGGGMAAVTGFVLRLVMILLTPTARKILLLDETFGMVSASYVPAVAEFLREVTDRTACQVLMITHEPAYAECADVKYRLVLEGGVTKVFEGEAE
jgi:ABC-type uncharacterized transport system ATPase component